MKKIPLELLVQLRQIFFGRRQEIADKCQMHYNSIGLVLKGDLYNKTILQAMVDLMTDEEGNDELEKVASKVIKLINSKKQLAKVA